MAHLQNFQNLLKKVGYSKEDILVIDGDVLEKGPQSLATLRYVMQLAKEYTVYQVLGNNDWLWDELEMEDKQANEDLLDYMLSRNSIFNEMCMELGIEVSEQMDVTAMKRQLKAAFQAEWDYLRELPDILESEHYIFVHAGIESEDLQQQEKSNA